MEAVSSLELPPPAASCRRRYPNQSALPSEQSLLEAGDGSILTSGMTAEPTGGYRWKTVTEQSSWPPSWGGTPNTHPQLLALAVSRRLPESPRAGSMGSMSLGRAAMLLVSQLLGSGPSACSRTAGKTQNTTYQERALGELISSHTWLGTAQHIPRDTTGAETLLP